ncbi:MAG: outer membrane protein assembly factor BamD [Gallionellales bacterium CG_4_10_14_3_um_filter_54_96]|nr:MAG: outer membrane protein assembly factor BamD [Gallionellales bacterium CG03_land_8_20_14_0_80_55_15]PIV91116.1 MAG: outer membrane protein assembly factor BamD [Gallionellales bacterium CG17_big_fil_post_rev_8_21_14_2_50_54_146]PIX03538.1 MAG: outer membrane protein assembly factor BamD [Gallionellales bacterium CG_4_8_14_3_um_filter_54_18]PIY05550.1 MAG: outer membrane protein assembly factor BamD [Gallionellales bacterium CG_4_10_14_3_um_filter_54_96]PJC03451.1 MAG: outer membrane prot
MRHILAVFLLLTLTACSLFTPLPDGTEQTVQLPAAELYRQAKAELDDGNYSSAIKLYETLQSRYPYGRYAQQSMLEMAYAYYRTDEPDPAIATANRFIKQFPNNPHVDYAYYVKGLANFKGEMSVLATIGGQDPTERDPQGPKDAFNAFNELVTRFPGSKYTPDTRIRMRYLVNTLAKHELHIARYYLRRGAHIAAVNRAQGILSQYPNSSSTHEALAVMVQGYDAMGMTELRDDARRVLANNSAAAVSSDSDLSKPSWWQFWK